MDVSFVAPIASAADSSGPFGWSGEQATSSATAANAGTMGRISALRQGENVKRIAVGRMFHIRFNGAGYVAWATAAEARRHRDILLAAYREADRESLY